MTGIVIIKIKASNEKILSEIFRRIEYIEETYMPEMNNEWDDNLVDKMSYSIDYFVRKNECEIGDPIPINTLMNI
jgi:hypothetical protein